MRWLRIVPDLFHMPLPWAGGSWILSIQRLVLSCRVEVEPGNTMAHFARANGAVGLARDPYVEWPLPKRRASTLRGGVNAAVRAGHRDNF